MKFKIIFNLLFFSILSLSFFSCVDDVDMDGRYGEERKLVLYCRLCPQLDTTFISLSSSMLLYGADQSGNIVPYIVDATVELSADGHHWVKADFDYKYYHYFVTCESFPVTEGHTYYIRASYPGFEDISAICTVPKTHDVNFRFDTVSVDNDVHYDEICNYPHKDVYVEWHDVLGEQNAYGFFEYRPHKVFVEDPESGEYTLFIKGKQYYNPWLTKNNVDYQYVSDDEQDGQIMRYLLDYDIYEWEDDDDDEETKYYLFFLDRNSYLYETTITEYNEINFLLLEPPHTYSNIENGFGLFGAFSMKEVR